MSRAPHRDTLQSVISSILTASSRKRSREEDNSSDVEDLLREVEMPRVDATPPKSLLGRKWTPEDTTLFYKALERCGPDFTAMHMYLRHIPRKQLVTKYHRERKSNPARVAAAIELSHTHLSPSDVCEVRYPVGQAPGSQHLAAGPPAPSAACTAPQSFSEVDIEAGSDALDGISPLVAAVGADIHKPPSYPTAAGSHPSLSKNSALYTCPPSIPSPSSASLTHSPVAYDSLERRPSVAEYGGCGPSPKRRPRLYLPPRRSPTGQQAVVAVVGVAASPAAAAAAVGDGSVSGTEAAAGGVGGATQRTRTGVAEVTLSRAVTQRPAGRSDGLLPRASSTFSFSILPTASPVTAAHTASAVGGGGRLPAAGGGRKTCGDGGVGASGAPATAASASTSAAAAASLMNALYVLSTTSRSASREEAPTPLLSSPSM